jgi:methionine-R-sulfoxide reductase
VLTADQYDVARSKGTERPFSSELCSLFQAGRYHCVCCDTPLFDSTSKFESGTGWPSFTSTLTPDVVAYEVDPSYGMQGIEANCNVCDAHLGHVFPDGPPPSGLRFCINAVSLRKAKSPAQKKAVLHECFGLGEAALARSVFPPRKAESGQRVLGESHYDEAHLEFCKVTPIQGRRSSKLGIQIA